MNYLVKKSISTLTVLTLIFAVLILYENSAVVTSTNIAKTIVLDAGHGDPDGGAMGKSGVKESVINLQIANIVKSELENAGFNVIMTRTDENAINQKEGESLRNNKRADLKERVRIANESGASALLSIHMNYFGEEKSSGPQVFYSEKTDGGKEMAENIRAAFLEDIGAHCSREIKGVTDGIYLLKNSQITSVLVECGFLSNRSEEALLITSEYQEKIGKAIAKGIENYFLNNTLT